MGQHEYEKQREEIIAKPPFFRSLEISKQPGRANANAQRVIAIIESKELSNTEDHTCKNNFIRGGRYVCKNNGTDFSKEIGSRPCTQN